MHGLNVFCENMDIRICFSFSAKIFCLKDLWNSHDTNIPKNKRLVWSLLPAFTQPVVFPHEEDMETGEERLFINSKISSHKILTVI